MTSSLTTHSVALISFETFIKVHFCVYMKRSDAKTEGLQRSHHLRQISHMSENTTVLMYDLHDYRSVTGQIYTHIFIIITYSYFVFALICVSVCQGLCTDQPKHQRKHGSEKFGNHNLKLLN